MVDFFFWGGGLSHPGWKIEFFFFCLHGERKREEATSHGTRRHYSEPGPKTD